MIYNFRLEIVEKFIKDGHEVHISSPYGNRIDELVKLGCIYHSIKFERHGINPISEVKLIFLYKKLIKIVKPDIIFGFTIKPNIYGAIAAKSYHYPFVANITGLGTAVGNGGIKQKLFLLLYKYAFKEIQRVFFQNTENQELFLKNAIGVGKNILLPGSGVNLKKFMPLNYPGKETIEFVFISRIMKEKGIEQYLQAARYISSRYPNTKFHICGFCEKEYKGRLDEYIKEGFIIYHGLVQDIRSIIQFTHCTVHPTYYPEGISNVLLESSACARPIITTDRAGCREVIDDGINGYKIPEKNTDALIVAIERFIALSWEEKRKMGLQGRIKVEASFDRCMVVEAYERELKQV